MTATIRNRLLGIALASAGLLTAEAASAYERWVDVVNEGDYAIYAVQITHVDRNDFGADLLGEYVIPAGYEMRVEPRRPQGYCRFDVLITYETGDEVTLWDVNLCEVSTIYASDSGYTDVSY